MSETFQAICEALIDQGRSIEEDPVGYACANPARWRAPVGADRDVLLCDVCKALLATDPERVTLRFRDPAERIQMYQRVVADMKGHMMRALGVP